MVTVSAYKSNSIKLQIQRLINRFQKQRTYLTIVLPQHGSTHIIHIHTVSVLTVYICTVVGSEHPVLQVLTLTYCKLGMY